MLDPQLHVNAALLKLSYTWYRVPEARLYLAVIEQALLDVHHLDQSDHQPAMRDFHARTARNFLNGPLTYADYCGLSPEFVKQVLKKLELL